ncbi:MAG: 16S rRNA (guanine(966)-N(2))-methyltransferase RsmD [Candidatus Omnitrophica bacterium]|nr:16S rRNA (guanine(966)-N(2))-methyltransferase RsmD [Candidatus Omnitrophota bacterium]
MKTRSAKIYLTGGRWKGRALLVPPGVRATEAKVRQALGNILGPVLEGARVLDAFAGSGAIGFEALSRGAAFVAFLDESPEAVLAIRDNLARLGRDAPRSAWRVMQMDVVRGLRELAESEPPFDVIVLDPPYRSEEGKKALNGIAQYAILAHAGIVAVEHHQRTVPPPAVGPLRQFKRHRYGDTVLSFYRAASP